jgi:hypothetical protein
VRRISHCVEFSATDLFVAQRFLLLPFLVPSAKFIILIHCTERVLQFIVARLKLTYTNTMETSQRKRKNARSGRVVRFEPQDLKLINADPRSGHLLNKPDVCISVKGFKDIMHN